MRNALLFIVAIVLFLMAGAHGVLGGRALQQLLADAHANDDLVRTATAGWWFGSACMAGFGLIAALAAARSRRGDASLDPALRATAIAFAAFGVGANLVFGWSPHFVGFVAVAALVWFATAKKPAAAGQGRQVQ